MVGHNLTLREALERADAFRQLGIETVYLRDDAPDLPWDKVVAVSSGCSYRLSIPTSIKIEAICEGLSLEWSFSIEGWGANGTGQHRLDRGKLRDLAMLLPKAHRATYASLLKDDVLPEVEKRTCEMRDLLHSQWDSEDCLRGVIDIAQEAAR